MSRLMYFPELEQFAEETKRFFHEKESVGADAVRVIVSPYRVCPLGAHIDHQGGPVLGKTINACSILAYAPLEEGTVRLHSKNFDGAAAFSFDDIGHADPQDWGRYARGAVYALSREHKLKRGIAGALNGSLAGSGLSSSASVGLACLTALAEVNDIELTPSDLIEMDRVLENDYLGLSNGILDQATIVHGRNGTLVHIDTLSGAVEYVKASPAAEHARIVIAYSGYPRTLIQTSYNDRVRECRDAARLLGERCDCPDARKLSDIETDAYREFLYVLPDHLARRAQHYFGEVDRVRQGITAWEQGNLPLFGSLMTDSCRSSMNLYEAGSEPIRTLQEIMETTEGMWGSRFSGGGYSGCVIGLVDEPHAEEASLSILRRYTDAHPTTHEMPAVYLARPGAGLHRL